MQRSDEDFTKDYFKFVDSVTSDESKNFQSLSSRLDQLNEEGANVNQHSILTPCQRPKMTPPKSKI
jgi:hypothetical protein